MTLQKLMSALKSDCRSATFVARQSFFNDYTKTDESTEIMSTDDLSSIA
jgi:hypothetical protein